VNFIGFLYGHQFLESLLDFQRLANFSADFHEEPALLW